MPIKSNYEIDPNQTHNDNKSIILHKTSSKEVPSIINLFNLEPTTLYSIRTADIVQTRLADFQLPSRLAREYLVIDGGTKAVITTGLKGTTPPLLNLEQAITEEDQLAGLTGWSDAYTLHVPTGRIIRSVEFRNAHQNPEYNAQTGMVLAQKHLKKDRLKHSIGVGNFAHTVAYAIADENPELELAGFDPDMIAFLGFTHDIGYAENSFKHECHSITSLLEEGTDPNIAHQVMHGQLLEQFGPQEGVFDGYCPRGLAGMILTYADMHVRFEPEQMENRRDEILDRVREHQKIPESIKAGIIKGMNDAFPRFERYRRVVHTLGNVDSFQGFLAEENGN